MTATKTYDVAVVGAGVFGAWIARTLRTREASAACLMRMGDIRGQFGRQSRIIRMDMAR